MPAPVSGVAVERDALFAEIDRLRGQLVRTRAAAEDVQTGLKREIAASRAETMVAIDDYAFIRSLLDANQDCIKVLDLEGRVMITSIGGARPLRIGDPKDDAGTWWPGRWPEPGKAMASRAIEQARSGGSGRFVAAYPSPDGPPKWWDVHVTPILGAQGLPDQLLSISRDVTEQQTQLEKTAERDALQRAILESSTDYAIISLDREGRITSWNSGAQQIMQWSEHEMLGRPAHAIFTAEEIAAGRPEQEMRDALQTGRGEDERWHLKKDGSRFWANGLMMPLKTDAGRHIGFIQVLRDRTQRKHNEDQRELMMGELNHRVKNTLAVVQAVVSQTLRTATSPDEARQAVVQRLGVISRAQDLLTHTSWTAAPVSEVVAAATAPMAQGLHRLVARGPAIEIGPRAVLSLTMALHELGTNAFKYGAFSNETGRVIVSWRVESPKDGDHDGASEREPWFSLTWREHDGPLVSPPTRKGFGSRLIEFGLARGLGGTVELRFDPQGVCWSVSAPLAAVQAS